MHTVNRFYPYGLSSVWIEFSILWTDFSIPVCGFDWVQHTSKILIIWIEFSISDVKVDAGDDEWSGYIQFVRFTMICGLRLVKHIFQYANWISRSSAEPQHNVMIYTIHHVSSLTKRGLWGKGNTGNIFKDRNSDTEILAFLLIWGYS